MKIIAVFGKSGVGKGTVATMLCMLDDRLHHSKFARPMKRELEQEYELPEGFLEHRLMKSKPSGYKGQTFLDVMVRLYHERQPLTELPEETMALLSHCRQYGLVPVFDDCRNDREAHALAVNDTLGIWVDSGERGVALSSDTKQYDIYKSCKHRYRLENNDSLADLLYEVQRMYSRNRFQRWLAEL